MTIDDFAKKAQWFCVGTDNENCSIGYVNGDTMFVDMPRQTFSITHRQENGMMYDYNHGNHRYGSMEALVTILSRVYNLEQVKPASEVNQSGY